MNDRLPNILIVDDENGTAYEASLTTLSNTRARHPSDVEIDDLLWADLVLIDYFIQDWPTRDKLDEIGLQPPNGLALAAVFRERVDAAASDDVRHYTAFAIHSGHIVDISRRLHTSSRAPQVVARLNNLEWAFDKDDRTRFESETALATGVREVSRQWAAVESKGLDALTSKMLQLPNDQFWTERALEDVQLCQVPLSAISAGTNGLTFIRWLAHTILPYPTFLWDKHMVAARLRVEVASLEKVLEGHSELAKELDSFQYRGVLSSFLGNRWWRSGIEQFAWNVGAEEPTPSTSIHARLEIMAGIKLAPIRYTSPVVCVERDLSRKGTVDDIENTVRLVPDLWPSYADPAYARISDVREETQLLALVHPLDRESVSNLHTFEEE